MPRQPPWCQLSKSSERHPKADTYANCMLSAFMCAEIQTECYHGWLEIAGGYGAGLSDGGGTLRRSKSYDRILRGSIRCIGCRTSDRESIVGVIDTVNERRRDVSNFRFEPRAMLPQASHCGGTAFGTGQRGKKATQQPSRVAWSLPDRQARGELRARPDDQAQHRGSFESYRCRRASFSRRGRADRCGHANPCKGGRHFGSATLRWRAMWPGRCSE